MRIWKNNLCCEQPKEEYTPIYAIDFDNTLAKTNYPTIIEPIQDVIDYCIDLKKKGNILILWTCRDGKYLWEAVKWCAEHGLIFDYINENEPGVVKRFGTDTRKIFANYYIDDRAKDLHVLRIDMALQRLVMSRQEVRNEN